MSRRRRSGAGPIVVLVAIALVPALVLWAVWRWADDRAAAADDAVPTVDDTTAPVTTDPARPALSTGLLSMRRTAGELSRRLNVEAFEQTAASMGNVVGPTSCSDISLDGQPIGSVNADTIVIPASNQKILVAAVAEDVLGNDFRYTTTVVGPQPVGGVVTGDVYLVGGGDPLLSGEWYPESNLDRFPVFDITSLDQLARDLAAAGVTRIDGTVRGDGSRYDDEYYVESWGPGVAGIEAGPYDGLLVNDSRVQGDDQRGSDPNEAGAREFVRILNEQGIAVSGGSGTGVAPTDTTELASIDSEPLPSAIAEMLTNSDNNTAEMMVKEIGLAVSGQGTREAGLAAIASTIAGWGIDTTGMVLGDGSGLSLDNRISCATLLAVLQHSTYDSSVGAGMAIAGETGTLSDIFTDTPVAGRLRGKTGTLNNPPFDQDPPAVKALSGYLPVDGGGAIEYVLILNGPTISDQSEYRQVWAELVNVLNSFPAVASPAALGPR
ncbi:MAG: D-alanyl-D-alanine carboxypeptidase/D-alanyl-D-alanine-endopeptidase [Ilumatobacter sp.]|nr:D-alanyl-D-alanine carboxypeptidase/D-alanyl-D-alanine-endopeptidase [Ilumatobacter sp.]